MSRRVNSGTIYKYKRTQLTSLSALGTAATFAIEVFTLGDLPSSSDFSNLYRQWRLRGVAIQIWCANMTQSFLAGTASATGFSGAVPTMYSAIDYEDHTIPLAITDLQQMATFRITPFANGRKFRTFFRPRAKGVAVTDATTNNGRTVFPSKQWFSTEDVVQYGSFKYAFDGITTNPGTLMKVAMKFYLEFKQPF